MRSKLTTLIALLFLVPQSIIFAAEEFQWVDDATAGTQELKFGEQPVLRYMYAYDTSTKERTEETFKVYHHVFGPGTKQIITKGAGGHFTHHRGLYVGWNKTQLADGQQPDFWHCTKGVHQKHVEFQPGKSGAESTSMSYLIHWNLADGTPAIVENRTLTVRKLKTETAPQYAWQIDWQTKLTSKKGDINLTGDRQHAGFQFRAHNDVNTSNGARYIRPAGFPEQREAFQVNDGKQKDEHINLGWFAMEYDLESNHYCVHYMEDPAAPKPSRYSERPYGRFGAFFEAKLTGDKPLEMKYRVVISTEKTPARELLQSRYDAFLADVKSNAYGK